MLVISEKKRIPPVGILCSIVFLATTLVPVLWGDLSHAGTSKQGTPRQETFKSPEAAVEALIGAVQTDNEKGLMAILGPSGERLVSSGDPVADHQARSHFLERYREQNRLVNGGDRKVILEIGKESWPVPIPIVMSNDTWRFDTDAGRDEILNRRIGRNELNALQVCLAYVDAQWEYADIMRTTEGRRQYAQEFVSEPGKRDGLYWETKDGEPQSPLGPLVADARKEGYRRSENGQPTPYHGYLYKILKAQGRHAPKGELDYVAEGNMIAGFALVAHPAVYGSTGIMTFIVSDDGVVYEKNLGRNTGAIVQRMNRFDPDRSWHKVDAKYLRPLGGGK